MASKITKEKLTEFANYILTGMTEKESCVLADISYDNLKSLMERNEEIREYIERKKVKFKYNHLKEIQSKKSERNSQWILEKLRPDEFGSKNKGEAPTINIISQIIKEIQNDTKPIIDITRGGSNFRELGSGEESDKVNRDPKLQIAEVLN